MQAKHLGLKFAFVALLVIMCGYSMWAKELRQGIDLKGGNVLTFEIVSSGKDAPDLVERVIARLRKRIDPSGTRSLEWRKVGPNRFEVRMPLGTDEARRAKQVYLEALQRLQDSNIQRSEIRRVVSLTGKDRADAIERIAAGNTEKVAALQRVAQTHDDEVLADESLNKLIDKGNASVQDVKKAREALDNARSEQNDAFHDLLKLNVNVEYLGQVMQLYVPKREADTLPRKELEERVKAYDEQLKQFHDLYKSRQTGYRRGSVELYQLDAATNRSGRSRRPEANGRTGRRAGVPNSPDDAGSSR